MTETLEQFFRRITGNTMLRYQLRYGSDPFRHTFIRVPTGLGKTLTVVVPWLYGIATGDLRTPTRLVIVLPRQNLTQQTFKIVCDLVEAAGLSVDVLELLGGSDDNRKTLTPDVPTMVVCTQDMYFSRALNRGYAKKPTRWPIDFALLNQDCLIVLDEIQLMSDALATSAQLAAFRDEFGIFGFAPTVWMSATGRPEWLDTVDFRSLRNSVRVVELDDEDKKDDFVQRRYHAAKAVAIAPEACRTPKGCAEFALQQHRPTQRTLIIANTVLRAREIHEALQHHPGAILLHSRFRRVDRDQRLEELKNIPADGQIIVATQVIEAGVDLTSHRMITDVASWASMVQRFGRVNRGGNEPEAEIWWVDQPQSSKKAKKPEDVFLPYTSEECGVAIERLSNFVSASPADLPSEDGAEPWRHVLRKSDLLDLFDTSPDLAGNHIDVSRFIRSGEEKDCYVAWREWDKDPNEAEAGDACAEELCPVPIGELFEFLGKKTAYVWNFTAREWEEVDRSRLYPGMVILAHVKNGGYTKAGGWNLKSTARVTPVNEAGDEPEADGSDPLSWVTYRQSLAGHTEMVRRAMIDLYTVLERLGLAPFKAELENAAAKHDWGKAHDVFQRALHGAENWTELLGKQKKADSAKYERRHFRHEFASALAMIAAGDSDLSVYLAAAHHGKVRMAVRSMPHEQIASRVRGIEHGDVLQACEPAAGMLLPAVTLSLDVVRIGANGDCPGWTDRMLRVRDQIGVFRLAFLEALLRTADERASEKGKTLEAAACRN